MNKGLFQYLEEKYGGFQRTWEVSLLEGGWSNGSRWDSMSIGRGNSTKLELYLVTPRYTLPRVKCNPLENGIRYCLNSSGDGRRAIRGRIRMGCDLGSRKPYPFGIKGLVSSDSMLPHYIPLILVGKLSIFQVPGG